MSLSADVAGRIVGVSVHDNQTVKAGDVLFTIDPEPYQIALDQAEAALATAQGQCRAVAGRLWHRQRAARSRAGDAGASGRTSMTARPALATQGSTAQASLDDVKLALQTAQNAVNWPTSRSASATAALGGDPEIKTDDHPAVRAALAAVEVPQRNLAKTTVVAPADGIVSQVASLNVGQFVATGTTIASLVETGRTWVQANFKETQLAALTAGMPAEISVDAVPGREVRGHCGQHRCGDGAEFALIPAQNATGNWVKVTQRIPVRIDVASVADAEALRAGMSAVVSVDTGRTTLEQAAAALKWPRQPSTFPQPTLVVKNKAVC